MSRRLVDKDKELNITIELNRAFMHLPSCWKVVMQMNVYNTDFLNWIHLAIIQVPGPMVYGEFLDFEITLF